MRFAFAFHNCFKDAVRFVGTFIALIHVFSGRFCMVRGHYAPVGEIGKDPQKDVFDFLPRVHRSYAVRKGVLEFCVKATFPGRIHYCRLPPFLPIQ